MRAGAELAGLVGGSPEELDERGARSGEPLGHLAAHDRVVIRCLPFEAGEAGTHPPGRDDEHRQQDERE